MFTWKFIVSLCIKLIAYKNQSLIIHHTFTPQFFPSEHDSFLLGEEVVILEKVSVTVEVMEVMMVAMMMITLIILMRVMREMKVDCLGEE